MFPPTCRAAVYAGERQLALTQIDVRPPGPGEVVFRTAVCGVCGSDLHVYFGRWEQQPPPPGHEFAGEVVAVGPDLADNLIGTRAAIEPLVYCGECVYCRTGRQNLCENGAYVSWTSPGGLAEYITIPAYTLRPLPDHVSDEQGALVEPLAVGLHAARLAPVQCADDVLVIGSGTIGLMSLLASLACGAQRVFVAAKYEHQAAAARDLGAADVLPVEEQKLLEALRDHSPLGADVVIETVGGAARTFNTALKAVRKGGRIALVGGFTQPIETDLYGIITREATVVGSNCYGAVGLKRDFEVAVELIAAGRANVMRLVTHRFPLNQVQQAYEVSADKTTGVIKALVQVRPEGS